MLIVERLCKQTVRSEPSNSLLAAIAMLHSLYVQDLSHSLCSGRSFPLYASSTLRYSSTRHPDILSLACWDSPSHPFVVVHKYTGQGPSPFQIYSSSMQQLM